jgi:cobalamin biosynthesis Mg chelatase CobN
MQHNKFNLESELRASRSQPRADFARGLADEVRSTGAATRSPLGRVGLALALSGLIVVALASFGGIGYASSSAPHAVKKPVVAKHAQKSTSAAHAQYAPFTPPTAKPKLTPPTGGTTESGTAAAGTGQAAPQATSSPLPFTGLALWVPLAVGLMLISLGLVLRTRGRRRHTSAH